MLVPFWHAANTPCLVRCGASAYALGKCATQRDGDLVHTLFSSVGMAICVEEKAMDAGWWEQ
jgi:pyrroline-5-carboxylate reductase